MDDTDKLNRFYRSGLRRGMYEAVEILRRGGTYQDILDAANKNWEEDIGTPEPKS